jgi:hypothetical protein
MPSGCSGFSLAVRRIAAISTAATGRCDLSRDNGPCAAARADRLLAEAESRRGWVVPERVRQITDRDAPTFGGRISPVVVG